MVNNLGGAKSCTAQKCFFYSGPFCIQRGGIRVETQGQPLENTTNEPASCCYSIEHVATRTGLTKRTLRYYEEVGLLPPAERTEGNYRRYSEADVQRLE